VLLHTCIRSIPDYAYIRTRVQAEDIPSEWSVCLSIILQPPEISKNIKDYKKRVHSISWQSSEYCYLRSKVLHHLKLTMAIVCCVTDPFSRIKQFETCFIKFHHNHELNHPESRKSSMKYLNKHYHHLTSKKPHPYTSLSPS
jgi:hypothetical protein